MLNIIHKEIKINNKENIILVKFLLNDYLENTLALNELLDYCDIIENTLLKIYNKKFLIKFSIKYKISLTDDILYYKMAKLTIDNLQPHIKFKLTFNKKPKLNVKEKKIIFEINKKNLNSLIKSKEYIEKVMNLLGAKIRVVFFYTKENIENISSPLNKKELNTKIIKTKKSISNNKIKKQLNNVKNDQIFKISELKNLPNNSLVLIEAKIVLIKLKKHYVFYLEDNTGEVKVITYNDKQKIKVNNFKKGDIVLAKGSLKHDKFTKEIIIWFREMILTKKQSLLEKDVPRFELHCHTKMSTFDGVSTINDYYEYLKEIGHKGMAIIDHDSVQSFPEANKIQKKDRNFKFLFGCEFTTLENNLLKLPYSNVSLDNCDFFIIDLETTGLFSEYDNILEIAISKLNSSYEGFFPLGHKIEKLHMFIQQEKIPTKNILDFSNISIDDLNNGYLLKNAIERLSKFISTSKNPILIAHNAFFDYKFLKKAFEKFNILFPKVAFLDSLAISRYVLKDKKNFSLGKVARAFKIQYDSKQAHSAEYDVEILTNVWNKLKEKLFEFSIKTTKELVNRIYSNIDNWEYRHVSVICKNLKGKKDLYELLTLSSIKYLNKIPRLPFFEIEKLRENLLIGSACWNGHVFQNALENNMNALKKWILKMDYIEIQPIEVYSHLLSDSMMTKDDIASIIKKIIDVALELKKPIVATSDSHFITKKDKIVRDIFINAEGLRGSRHEFYRTLETRLNPNSFIEGPNQIYRTTKDMMKSFDFLKHKINLEDLIINNPFSIANLCENFLIQPNKLYSPSIKDIDLEKWIKEKSNEQIKELYGDSTPNFVNDRIQRELKILAQNNFSIIYYISAKLVKVLAKRKALVGSRGSVGSSLVAYLLGITEVNPLPPHYFCKKCGNFILHEDVFAFSYDLPPKTCENCNIQMLTYGMSIPFETFLGLKGDKIPDIDLNIPSEHQIWSHDYIRNLIGEEYVFRAGTILTVAEKTAYAIYLKYINLLGSKITQKSKKDFIIEKMVGVKRTTGKHAGGIIIIPQNKTSSFFTPIQYPSNNKNDSWKTTHFDFDFLHDNLLKLDLLGHGDPSMIGHLMRLTNVNVNQIDYTDKTLVKLFSDCHVINVDPKDIGGETTGSIALPEFGTIKTRAITKVIKPKSFADLVRISGISHGDGLWKGNIENLIKKGKLLKNLVSCRDDIMIFLNKMNIPLDLSFQIMEKIRKGIKISKEEESIMRKNSISDEYIQMCKKINYLFPKAHAIAYVLMAYRCAYYKLNHKIAFYCAHFTWKVKKFPILKSQYTMDKLIIEFNKLKSLNKNNKNNEIKELNDLEIVLEMKARKINILYPNLNIANDVEYIEIKEKNAMMIPFVALDGFGKIGKTIIDERKKGLFKSAKDFKDRVKINIAQEKTLKLLHLLDF